MSDIAIQVENLSKRYVLIHQRTDRLFSAPGAFTLLP
jgi:hypothetical protein